MRRFPLFFVRNFLGERPNLRHHSGKAVAALRRDELIQADPVEEILNIERENILGVLPRIDALQNSNKPAHDVRISVSNKFENVSRARLLASDKINLAHASLHARSNLFEQIKE